MLDNNTIVQVTNRSNSKVGYVIDELHITRKFAKGETKSLPIGELRALSNIPGGRSIINNHLVINNEELVNELIYDVQPEYFYTDEDVKNLLFNGTLDQLIDALNFGQEGVKSLIKEYAIKYELNDVRKREAIKEYLHFDVTKAIEFSKEGNTVIDAPKARRAAPITADKCVSDAAPVERKTNPPKYTIIQKD